MEPLTLSGGCGMDNGSDDAGEAALRAIPITDLPSDKDKAEIAAYSKSLLRSPGGMQTARASLYLEAESMAQAMRILRKCVSDYRTGYAEAFLDIQRATLSAEAEAKTYDEAAAVFQEQLDAINSLKEEIPSKLQARIDLITQKRDVDGEMGKMKVEEACQLYIAQHEDKYHSVQGLHHVTSTVDRSIKTLIKGADSLAWYSHKYYPDDEIFADAKNMDDGENEGDDEGDDNEQGTSGSDDTSSDSDMEPAATNAAAKKLVNAAFEEEKARHVGTTVTAPTAVSDKAKIRELTKKLAQIERERAALMEVRRKKVSLAVKKQAALSLAPAPSLAPAASLEFIEPEEKQVQPAPIDEAEHKAPSATTVTPTTDPNEDANQPDAFDIISETFGYNSAALVAKPAKPSATTATPAAGKVKQPIAKGNNKRASVPAAAADGQGDKSSKKPRIANTKNMAGSQGGTTTSSATTAIANRTRSLSGLRSSESDGTSNGSVTSADNEIDLTDGGETQVANSPVSREIPEPRTIDVINGGAVADANAAYGARTVQESAKVFCLSQLDLNATVLASVRQHNV